MQQYNPQMQQMQMMQQYNPGYDMVSPYKREEKGYNLKDEILSDPPTMILIAAFFTMFVVFYTMDVESVAYDDEGIPDEIIPPKNFPSNQVIDDPTISSNFNPGAAMDGTTPSIFSFGGGGGVSGSDNAAFSWEPESGNVFYSALSFSPRMVFDWISNIGFRDISRSSPFSEFHDTLTMLQITREEAVPLLKAAAITSQRDLWELVSTPCASLTTTKFNSPSDCIKARRGLRILAWRFFSSGFTTIFPLREIRIRTTDPEERRLLGMGTNELYSSVRYFTGVVSPMDVYNPFLSGGEEIV